MGSLTLATNLKTDLNGTILSPNGQHPRDIAEYSHRVQTPDSASFTHRDPVDDSPHSYSRLDNSADSSPDISPHSTTEAVAQKVLKKEEGKEEGKVEKELGESSSTECPTVRNKSTARFRFPSCDVQDFQTRRRLIQIEQQKADRGSIRAPFSEVDEFRLAALESRKEPLDYYAKSLLESLRQKRAQFNGTKLFLYNPED